MCIGIKMVLRVFIVVCIVLCIGSFYRKAFAQRSQPLILQIQVSHPRNTDQTSLIFRQKTVELVTNVFQASSNQRQAVRLGHFHAPLNDHLKLLKRKVQVYRKLLNQRGKGIDLSKMMKATGVRSFHTDPHAPIIRLSRNRQSMEIKASHPYFQPLNNILQDAQKNPWTCLSCAEYKKKGKNIVRTFKKKGRQPASVVFSRSHLQCLNLNKQRIECLDQQFGLFELE